MWYPFKILVKHLFYIFKQTNISIINLERTFEIAVIECMKKLTSIIVLDHKIKIEYVKDPDNWGECDSDKMIIKLSTDCLKDPRIHSTTLMHEVTHMILRLSGVAFMEENDEEAYVRCIENLVIPWMLKNQHLIAPN